MPSLFAIPRWCIRHEVSAAHTMSGLAAATARTFFSPISDESCGNTTENVPPNPQQSAAPSNSTSSTPSMEPSSFPSAAGVPLPLPWQELWTAIFASSLPGIFSTPSTLAR